MRELLTHSTFAISLSLTVQAFVGISSFPPYQQNCSTDYHHQGKGRWSWLLHWTLLIRNNVTREPDFITNNCTGRRNWSQERWECSVQKVWHNIVAILSPSLNLPPSTIPCSQVLHFTLYYNTVLLISLIPLSQVPPLFRVCLRCTHDISCGAA